MTGEIVLNKGANFFFRSETHVRVFQSPSLNLTQNILLVKNFIIDTIHSVKGGEADNVLLYSKTNWPSAFSHKNREEQSDEKRVYYTGATRAKDTLHLLSTDHQYNYPMGEGYFVNLQASKYEQCWITVKL